MKGTGLVIGGILIFLGLKARSAEGSGGSGGGGGGTGDGGTDGGGGSGGGGGGAVAPVYGPLALDAVPWQSPLGWRTIVVNCTLTNLTGQAIRPKIKAVWTVSGLDANGQPYTGTGAFNFGTLDIAGNGATTIDYDGRSAPAGSTLLLGWSGGPPNPPVNYSLHLEDDLGGSSESAEFSL